MNVSIPVSMSLHAALLLCAFASCVVASTSPEMAQCERNVPEYFPQKPFIIQALPVSAIILNQPIHGTELALLHENASIAFIFVVEIIAADVDDVGVLLELEHSADFALSVAFFDDLAVHTLFNVSLPCCKFFDEKHTDVAAALFACLEWLDGAVIGSMAEGEWKIGANHDVCSWLYVCLLGLCGDKRRFYHREALLCRQYEHCSEVLYFVVTMFFVQ
jgi:hypothetical protein